ncbi:K(+)/H(+) antiporter subunit khtT [Nocardia brasiliensis]|nr:K(+)/H(+) antiporter subunit khtT [Nocardia brasiliensis]
MVAHRDGDIDLIVSKLDDPDACAAQIPLSTDEAAVLANLLGAPQLVAKLNDEHSDLPGITTRQMAIAEESPYAGRTLGETAMRTRTKVSIVAVMRAGQLHPSPGPDFTFTTGDLLVVVGTPEGLDAAAKILTHG